MVRVRITVRFTIVLLASLWGAAPASAAEPSAARLAAWDRMHTTIGDDAVVRWSRLDDVPISLRSGGARASLAGWSASHVAAVQRLFRDHADLFRLRVGIDAFEIAGEREQSGIYHLRAVQTWHGLPVRGGQYMVSVGADGRLGMIAGRSVPDVESDIQPVLTASEAIGAAASSRGRTPGRDSTTTALAIEPADGRDRLVYEVRLVSRTGPDAWEILVDARDGTIAGTRDLGFGASGCGEIWDPNPDHPLREDDFEIADPVAGVARLEGPQVRVLHENVDEPVSSTVLPQGCFDFQFDPALQPEAFDQANVYWNVDHFVREFHGGNGFAGMPEPITVILHPFHCGEANTGETIGNTIWLTSEGCGYKSSTRDGDIIDHETQHAVNNSFGLEGGTDRNREIYATALHEALANYFSCAAHNDPVYAEYFFGPEGFANCNSDPAEYNYSRIDQIGVGILQNYLIGMIWSGALWDIRTAIGPVIDRIALESLGYLPATPTFFEAADAIMQVDSDRYGGIHEADMRAAFLARGLGPGLPNPSIRGPAERYQGEAGTWRARICCARPPYTYLWRRQYPGSSVAETIGTDSVVTTVSDYNFILLLRVVDASGGVMETSRLIQVAPLDMTVTLEGPRQVLPDVPGQWTVRATSSRPVDATIRWSRQCLDPRCQQVAIPETTGTLTLSLTEDSRLFVTVAALGRSYTRSLEVEVDAVPIVGIDGPASLAPFHDAWLAGTVQGGLPPYLWRWTRNGLGAGDVIASSQTVQVFGDTLEYDIYLTVTSALGLVSAPVRHTISPTGIPLVVEIDGPDRLQPRVASTWNARIAGGQPPTVTYRWTRGCSLPECVPESIGTGPTLTLETSRNLDLGLTVNAGARTATVTRRVVVEGVPTAGFTAPDWLAPDEPATLDAEVTGGRAPYTYRWSQDGLAIDNVIGTESWLRVRGENRDVTLYLTITSADGLESDAAYHVIHSGLGPRPVPDHPAFTVDRTVVREGGDLTFTLAGRPGSRASLRLHDIAGRQLVSVFEGSLPQGIEFIAWNAGSLRSGVYLAVARIADRPITRRLVVVR